MSPHGSEHTVVFRELIPHFIRATALRAPSGSGAVCPAQLGGLLWMPFCVVPHAKRSNEISTMPKVGDRLSNVFDEIEAFLINAKEKQKQKKVNAHQSTPA